MFQSFGGSGLNLTTSDPHNVEPLQQLHYPVTVITSSSVESSSLLTLYQVNTTQRLGFRKLKHTHRKKERETTPTTYLCYITIPLPTHAPICSPVSHRRHRYSSSTQQNVSWLRFFWGDSRKAPLGCWYIITRDPPYMKQISQMDFSQNLTPGDEVCFEGGPLMVAKLLPASSLKGRGPRNHTGTGKPRGPFVSLCKQTKHCFESTWAEIICQAFGQISFQILTQLKMSLLRGGSLKAKHVKSHLVVRIYLNGSQHNAGYPSVSSLQQQDASLDTGWSIFTTEWDWDQFWTSQPFH